MFGHLQKNQQQKRNVKQGKHVLKNYRTQQHKIIHIEFLCNKVHTRITLFPV